MSGTRPSARVLRDLVAVLPHIVILVDENRKIRYINRAEVGYTIDDALGADAIEFIAPDAREEWARLFERVLTTGEAVVDLTWAIEGPAETAWYQASHRPIVREGRVAYVGVIARNVTERVLAERQLVLMERLLPICLRCKRVRTEQGEGDGEDEWSTAEAYLEETTRGRISHGMCPDCEGRLLRGDLGREPAGSG